MVQILLRILGVFLVLGALYAAWLGVDANADITPSENTIQVQRSALAGKKTSKEKADEEISKAEREIEEKKTQRNLGLGGAVVGLIVGFGLILMPSPRKRKSPAAAPAQEPAPAPTPAQNQDAPGP